MSNKTYSLLIFDQDQINFALHVNCENSNDPVVYWFDAVIRCFLPFILMLLGNISIIYSLKKSNKRRQDMLTEDQAKDDDEQLQSMTISMLAASFTYLFLTLPHTVCHLYNYLMDPVLHINKRLLNKNASDIYLFQVCANCSILLNNSINFMIYCLGGEKFNKQFQIMCGCQKRVDPRQKVIDAALVERKRRLEKHQFKEERFQVSPDNEGAVQPKIELQALEKI